MLIKQRNYEDLNPKKVRELVELDALVMDYLKEVNKEDSGFN